MGDSDVDVELKVFICSGLPSARPLKSVLMGVSSVMGPGVSFSGTTFVGTIKNKSFKPKYSSSLRYVS